jgi:hypothetical protein
MQTIDHDTITDAELEWLSNTVLAIMHARREQAEFVGKQDDEDRRYLEYQREREREELETLDRFGQRLYERGGDDLMWKAVDSLGDDGYGRQMRTICREQWADIFDD